MPIAHLPDRGVVKVSGPDAATLLQGLVTCNVAALAAGEAGFGALLAPQGKILFDFFVLALPDGGGFLFDTPAALAADLAKRLGFYKLRAKAVIENLTADQAVAVQWDEDAVPPGVLAFGDPRLAQLGHRLIGPRDAIAALGNAQPEAYHARRIALGVPEGGRDYAFGYAFPHEADMDQLHGVDFKKGCFVGQEVVSRMQHRGTARNRIVQLDLADTAAAPPPGTELLAGDTRIGTLASLAGSQGLALVRIDRLTDALADGRQVMLAETPVRLAKPAWASFAFPD